MSTSDPSGHIIVGRGLIVDHRDGRPVRAALTTTAAGRPLESSPNGSPSIWGLDTGRIYLEDYREESKPV
jgi:hypothetical protein